MRRPVAAAVAALMVAATGCSGMTANDKVSWLDYPQNEGANASAKGLYIRNAFLLDGSPARARPGSPTGELQLYAVLVNDRARPVRLERVTVQGGGSVRLAGTIEVPARGLTGSDRPIGTATGVPAEGSVPMTFTLGGVDMRLMVAVKPRTGQYATYSPPPQEPAAAPAPPAKPAKRGARDTSAPSPTRTP